MSATTVEATQTTSTAQQANSGESSVDRQTTASLSDRQGTGIAEDGDSGERQQQQHEEPVDTKNDETEDWTVQREALKSRGDQAFRVGQFDEAILHYTAALSIDPDSAVILSNRSAAYLKTFQKSKALHDAQACVKLGTMGLKGRGRLAAALQALGRYQPALDEWNAILQEDPKHDAALKGKQDCENFISQLEKQQEQASAQQEEDGSRKEEAATVAADSGDGPTENESDGDLDDFFNEVEEATHAVAKEKELADEPAPTDAIKMQKKDLGTAAQQVERLLRENYQWWNLNPFHVLDIPHTATTEDIARRFKALSLLLHPDKNRGTDADRVAEAYDQVMKAKAVLDDEVKANHTRQLVEQGMKQGKSEWASRKSGFKNDESLEDCQKRAVQKIFAEIEYKRREVERRERNQEQRERQQEEAELDKERKARQFDQSWKKEERVEKRIGSWRDFQKKKKPKAS